VLKDEKQMLWKLSGSCLGAALPLVILGPGVMAAVLIFGILCGLMATKGNSLRSTLKFLATSKVLYILCAFFMALLASAYFSIDQIHSMKKMGDIVGMGMMALMFYIALREMPTRHTDIIYRSLTISTVVVASFCLIDAFAGSDRFSQALHGDNAALPERLAKMSGVFAVLMPFIWAWLFRRYREGEVMVKWFAVPITVVTLLALFVSGGYVGWAAFVVALFIFLFTVWRYHGLHFHVKPVLGSVFLLVFALLCYGWSRGFNQPEDFMSIMHAEEFTPRVDLWQIAWAHMFDQPFTGIGVNTFRFVSEGASHPYNFLLQLFLETGFIGGSITICLLIMMLKYFMRSARSNLYGAAGLASIAAFLVAALTSTSIFHPWWLTMLIFSAIFSARVGWAIERKG
tara:strand:- start:52912 stop:54111 length:1200 start_codon:yes stop_codon:yes gene_type:complete